MFNFLASVAIILILLKFVWWGFSFNQTKAVAVAVFMTPILFLYALRLFFMLWWNSIVWTYHEYLRKLNAKNHQDSGL